MPSLLAGHRRQQPGDFRGLRRLPGPEWATIDLTSPRSFLSAGGACSQAGGMHHGRSAAGFLFFFRTTVGASIAPGVSNAAEDHSIRLGRGEPLADYRLILRGVVPVACRFDGGKLDNHGPVAVPLALEYIRRRADDDDFPAPRERGRDGDLSVCAHGLLVVHLLSEDGVSLRHETSWSRRWPVELERVHAASPTSP